jgi:hypothetical protein
MSSQCNSTKTEGIPVQFLVPPLGLEEEALEQFIEQQVFGVKTRVFSYEHLSAIKRAICLRTSRLPMVSLTKTNLVR